MYLLTNERYKTYQMGFSFGHLGHAQGWDLGVPWGAWGGGGGGGGGGVKKISDIQPDFVCELLT